MENNVTIHSSVQKMSKNNKPYWALKTDNGNMACWLPVEAVKMQVGKAYTVETEVNGNFVNIIKVIGEAEVEIVKEAIKPNKFLEARSAKDTSIYTSYVKDLVIAGKTVEDSIAIIKQAREAF